ncbi:MAG: UvrB/UvrC motif-containing protein [Planctomycetes bacterium]|nr:UvrB/UvrC motif-containing protein [Planctomycetota bacterium]
MHTLCQLCSKRPATTHLTEMDASGARKELHLCGQCLQATGVRLEDGPPSIASLLDKPAPAALDIEVAAETGQKDVDDAGGQCQSCGLEFSEYVTNNLFGCSEDYAAFHEQLDVLLKRYHGATRHIGRAPERVAPTTARPPTGRQSKRAALEKSLKQAVAQERYEDAAALRDQLQKLGDRPPT